MKKTTAKKSRKKASSTKRKRAPLASTSGFPIVGIGASAGGIEAVSTLLNLLPDDTGMAFVLIQHLAAKHKSFLNEILQRHTRMKVVQAKNGAKVEKNCFYVIPPNARMGISDGRLSLSVRNDAIRFMPVDFFFQCLAEDQKGLAIAVVLTGADSDGTEGLRSIRAEGGFSIAQDPRTATQPEMPNNSIATGNVDKILSLPEIASELARLGKNPLLKAGPENLADKEAISRIQQILRFRTGVDFTHYKHGTFSRRLARRLLITKISSFKDYIKVLEQESRECDDLFRDLLINVTSFFRDPKVFEALQVKILPAIFEKHPAETPIRVWVPGCATGEEVYSLAILLIESMEKHGVAFPLQLFATDLSEEVLDTAREGFYPSGIAANVSPKRLSRFFKKVANGYKINTEVRELCVFAKHDLASDPPFSRMDLISCRNLLIYLDPTLQKHVINTLGYASNPGGYLLLGTSESLVHSDRLFASVNKEARIYSRRVLAGQPRFELPQLSLAVHKKVQLKHEDRRDDSMDYIERKADHILAERFGPPGVIVNEQMQILRFRGQTGQFLESPPGQPDANLIKMARGALNHELLILLNKVKKENKPVFKETVAERAHETGKIVLGVYPIRNADATFYLVTFEHFESADAALTGAKLQQTRLPAKDERPSAKTREELAATREYLQSIISDQERMNEELKTANEEIMSSNEELQSTNEELETAKEELQSTNEELTTVNEELSNRNLLLSRSTSDLTNLLASVDLPIIMVGNDLRIRRFTPKAQDVFNIIAGDIGRPITQIRANLDLGNLDELIATAIKTKDAVDREVSDRAGRKYYLRIRRYHTEDNKIDGVVILVLDIPRF